MEMRGKTFIITGGGSGLGRGTAEVFTEAGANVVLADIDEATGQAAAEALGAVAHFVRCDVASEEDVRAAIRVALETCGGLHGAVNCAGVALARKVASRKGAHPLDEFARVLRINLTGTFNVIRLCAAAMAEQEADANGERGVFINTASVAAFEGQVGQAAYAASKGGVVSMTLPIARELASAGMRVLTIVPGLFDTPMSAALPEEIRDSLAQQIPFPKRFGRPREFGALARHMVENPVLNGECIRLDGGIRMQPR